MTDVNIAVELMKDAYDDAFDTALLLSAASDLTAPAKAIREQYPAKRAIIVFPPERRSAKLESIANGKYLLSEQALRKSQFPEAVTKPNGYALYRPPDWK